MLERLRDYAQTFINEGAGSRKKRRRRVFLKTTSIKADHKRSELLASYITKERKHRRFHSPCDLDDQDSIDEAKAACIKALRSMHHVPHGTEMQLASKVRGDMFAPGAELADEPAWGELESDIEGDMAGASDEAVSAAEDGEEPHAAAEEEAAVASPEA